MLMVATSFSMIKKSKIVVEAPEINFSYTSRYRLLVGVMVFLVQEVVLIIPALLFFGNLPMNEAVGTSLFIIFINSCLDSRVI
jgi:uncharacterized membrane protein YfcA